MVNVQRYLKSHRREFAEWETRPDKGGELRSSSSASTVAEGGYSTLIQMNTELCLPVLGLSLGPVTRRSRICRRTQSTNQPTIKLDALWVRYAITKSKMSRLASGPLESLNA
jgi:hypothetical protein